MKRLTALLLSAILLFAGCAAQAPEEAGPALQEGGEVEMAEDEMLDFDARYMKYVHGEASGFEPVVSVLSTDEERKSWAECLDDVEKLKLDAYALEIAPKGSGRSLIAISFEAGSGSIDVVVTDVVYADGLVTVKLEKRVPEVCTMDMVCWTVFVGCKLPEGAEVTAVLSEVNV